jgi:hypothetical protein
MGRKSYAALRHQCGLAGLSQQGDREAMQKRLQRLRLQPRTQMSITELSGALRDLGQKTPRNQRSKKDLQRLLAKNECSFAGLSQEGDRQAMQKRLQRVRLLPRTKMSRAEMIHALRDFGQRIPRNQRSKKDLQRLLAKRLAQSQATTQNLPFNRLSEGLRKVAAASLAGFGLKSKPPTFVDYCCGMGGASLGAHQAGYRILGAVDVWQVACSSYGLNLPAEARQADLASDSVIWNEEVDCMWASMPCQSFSLIGNRLGISDERGKLSVTFADHLKSTKPRVFVFENSPNLIPINGGYDIGIIEKAMRACGYKLSRYFLDSTKFGLCQKRRRLFIVQTGKE